MDKVFLAGHNGLVGRAIGRLLGSRAVTRPSAELDLTNQAMVRGFFAQRDFDSVILAAGRVGGISDNIARPAEFGYDNAMIALNVIQAARESGVKKLLFLGSSCMYPVDAAQPMQEGALLTGSLEPTNEMYALAKIFGVKECEAVREQYALDYTSLIPCNIYGPHDHFWDERAHVIPSLIRRFHEATDRVVIWGDGAPLREFLHVDDLAAAVMACIAREVDEPYLNVGSGEEISIADLAGLIAEITGFQGEIIFDASQPSGSPRKIIDSSRLRLYEWQPTISLRDGLEATYKWFLKEEGVGV